MAAAEHPLYRYLRVEYDVGVALPVPRASLGLMATLRAWVAAGHEPVVALCADVCHDVVAAVLGANCRPLFLDLDPATGEVASQEWARARAGGASVALVVHLYGNPADVATARVHFPPGRCLLIDDAAQALGVRSGGKPAGSLGDVGLLSFGPTKHIEAGGAAVLVNSVEFAASVQRHLAAIPQLPEAEAAELRARFRRGLEISRARLRTEGDAGAEAFAGLLDGYPPALGAMMPQGSADAVWREMQDYDLARRQRCAKAAAWACGLFDTGFLAVGMGKDAVPWRYACRLPGTDWAMQHRLAEAMRARRLDVSHWYLPAHWMCGAAAGSLPGVERLAREIFQFWVDADTRLESISDGAAAVAAVLRESRQ